MATPIFWLGRDDAVGGDGWQSQPPRRGECLVAPPARSQLGVEVLGPAEAEYLRERGDRGRGGSVRRGRS